MGAIHEDNHPARWFTDPADVRLDIDEALDRADVPERRVSWSGALIVLGTMLAVQAFGFGCVALLGWLI